MPPLRQHQQQLSNVETTDNILPGSSPGPIDNNNNDENKENRRGKRSPSIDTRASRVGVTNFINVIKSLHPGETKNYFPLTKEILQEYLDSKRKSLIKAGSLEQYLQHIQAYNIALGFGWQGQIFGPIIKKALDELKAYEEETRRKKYMIYHNLHLISQPQTTFSPINSIEYVNGINPSTTAPTSATSAAGVINYFLDQSKKITLVCFDVASIPHVIMSQQVDVPLSNLNSTDPLQNLRQLYTNIESLNLPSQWDPVDTSLLHYRIGNWNSSHHFGLNDGSAFCHFWKAFIDNINERENQVQLVIYRKQSLREKHPLNPCIVSQQTHAFNDSTSEAILRSVTIRSKIKIYKRKVAIGENTTFASLIVFATNKATPPMGKQFVIRSIDETFEYIPENLVKETITGIEHTELLVTLEEVNFIDFNQF